MPLVRVRILHGKTQLAAPSRLLRATKSEKNGLFSRLLALKCAASEIFNENSVGTAIFPVAFRPKQDLSVAARPKTRSQGRCAAQNPKAGPLRGPKA